MARKTLTAAAVERIKAPAAGRAEHFDAALPGFALRVTDKAAKSWVLFYRVQSGPERGKQRRWTIGTYPALGLADAREVARKGLRSIAEGGDPAREKRESRRAEPPRVDTFTSVAAEFIERHAKRKTRSWRETQRILERELVPYWGNRPIGDIGRRDVLDILDRLTDRGAPYMANRVLAVTRKLFNWGVERGIMKASPVANIKAPGQEIERDHVLSDDELRALWGAWDAMGYPFGPMMQMLLATAQRREEVAGMRWADVDPGAAIWTLPRELTKAGRSHEVPLSPIALEVLAAVPRFAGEYVFSSTGGEKSVSGFSRMKRRADQLSGVENWRLHDLRRTAGTHMAKLGIPVFVISRVMNHAEGGVTKIYARASYLEEKRHALNTWAAKLASLVSAKPDEKVVPLRG